MSKLEQIGNQTVFNFMGQPYNVTQTESGIDVAEGVTCDTYAVEGYEDVWDLGIIHIAPECQTPKQLVVAGTRTFEGIVEGYGEFEVHRFQGVDPEVSQVDAEDDDTYMRVVYVGDSMQWRAGVQGLVAYEVCWPPYQEGRFENLPA